LPVCCQFRQHRESGEAPSEAFIRSRQGGFRMHDLRIAERRSSFLAVRAGRNSPADIAARGAATGGPQSDSGAGIGSVAPLSPSSSLSNSRK